ncbi:MAG: PAS domain S-box protein [Anaerolineae bacterium]
MSNITNWDQPQTRITLIYVLVASIWILFSDAILHSLGIRESLIPGLSIIKGLVFVLVTGTILYVQLHREFQLRYQLEQALRTRVEHARQSQSALEASEKRLRKAVENAPLPIIIFAEDGEILTLSEAWLEITGYSREQLATIEDWTALAYGDRQQTIRERIERLFTLDHRVDEGAFEITCQDGSQCIWEFSSTHLGELADRRQVAISIAVDTTEARRMRDERHQTNQFLNTLIEASPLGIVMFDRDGIVQLWNPAMTDLLGWQASEAIGHHVPFVREQDMPQFEHLRGRVAQGEIFNGIDVQRQRKDGTVIDMSISAGPLYDLQGAFSGVVGIIKDIRERKQMENALRESETRFRQMAENISEVFYLRDAITGQMLYISPAYADIWGRSCESLYEHPRSFFESIHPDDQERVQTTFKQQHAGKPVEVSYRVIRPDQSVRWVRSQSFPIADKNGQVIRVAGIAGDITERVRYERQLNRLSQRLMTVLDDERARIARELHDQVGQQLTGLSLNLSVIGVQCSAEHPIQALLDDSTELIGNIIEHIRYIIADLRPLVLDDMGLGAGLRWYCEKFSRRAQISVHLNLPEDNLAFTPMIDNTFYQIAQEALTNIAKHADASQVWIDLMTETDQLIMSVRDDGIGFEASPYLAGEHSGSWGLQIMQERIRALVGSRLEITSNPDTGTEVKVVIQI